MQIIKYNASSKDDNRGGGTADRALNNKFQGMINQAVNEGSAVGTAVDELWKKGNASGSLVPKDSSNITEGQDSMAIGTSTETMSQGELAIGVFNETNGDKMFTIGDGQDEGSRHNLFEVTKFGNVNTTGDIYTPKTVIGSQGVAGAQGSFNNIIGSQGDIANINSDLINTKNLNVTVKAIIKALQAEDITCDNLTVTKAAHFFKLIIDEIKASKGQIIITPANAKIDLVESKSGGWRCYFRASDADGNQIHNSFEANDQIVCQTFNAATGTSYNVSNTYYWRKCTGVSSTPVDKTIDGQLVPCHWFDLSSTDKDQYTNSTPSAGDECVMLGNRTDTARQAAIIISAYNNAYLDNEIQSPAIVQYDGINDYNLKNHRLNVISKGLNSFRGTFTTTTGDDIETLIDDIDEKADGYEKTYLHTAWANSADGRTGFTKTQNGGDYLYIGFCANFTESDASLTYSDYRWSSLKGAQGHQGATGANGTSVTITNKSVTYQKSTSGTTVPTGTWKTTTPVLQKGDYLWTRTIVYYSDGNSTTAYSVSYLGIDGTNGSSVTITSTSVKYAITTTSTKPADSSFTYTSMPSVGVGDYLWSMQTVTFSDGATIKNYTVSRIGADGTDGDDGLDGKTTHWAYATSADGSQNFSTTMFNGATYIGSYDDYVRADSTNYRSYTWTKLKGETGAQGDDGAQGPQGHQGNQGANGTNGTNGTSVTITSKSITYAVTSTSSQPADSSFTYNSVPSVGVGQYLWAKMQVTFSDGNTIKSYSVSRIGTDGTDGDDGLDGKTTHWAYATSADGSQNFSTTMFNGATYIGSYDDYVRADSTNYRSYTWTKLKGEQGPQGNNGANGTSVTITSKSVTYQRSTSGTTVPTGTWSTSIPSNMTKGYYLWTKTVVTYSDGQSTTAYSVAYWGLDGTDGSDGANGTNGTNGADAEFYTLVPVKEQAVVDRNGTLGVSATYNIVHVKGATTETIYATQSGYHVLLIPNNATQSHMYDICSYNTYSPSYTNTSYQTNYLNQSSKTLYLTARLVYGSSHSTIEGVSSFIPVIMSASATLYIDEDLNTITSTVQGHTTSISTLTNNYSSISQDMSSIKSRVSATEIGLAGAQVRIANAESSITQTANSLRTEVKNYTDQQIAAIDLSGAKTVLVDASSLSESYAYPVVIDFQNSNDPNWIRCQVFKTLDASRYGTCSYSNHNSGSISLLLDWYTKPSGWGTNTVNATWSTSDNTRYIEDYAVNWTNANSTTKIVGSIRQNTEVSREIVYVRGGSKYDVRTSFKNATITLYSSGYSWSSGSYSFSAPRISISSLVIPVPDKMRRSEIVQTADNIQLNVYNDLRTKTGIDVSAGQITLNADNTTIVGNLNITDTSHGLTMYESGAQGAPRVNLQPQEVPTFSSLSSSDMYDWLYYSTSSWSRTSYDSSYSYFQCTPHFNNAGGTTISINRNDDIGLSDIRLSTPSSLGTVYMKLVATCNGTSYTIFDYSYCTYKTENSYYYYHPYYFDCKHFTAPVTGSYTFTAYIRTSSSYSSISSCEFRICFLRGGVRQTFMGTNGFYAAQGGYKYLYASDDQIRLQNGLGGIRIKHYEKYGNAATPPLIEVGIPYSGSGATVKPFWVPFYNYTPLTLITGYEFTSKPVYYNNSSYTQYVYDVPGSYEMNGILFLQSNTATASNDLFIRLPYTGSYLDSAGSYLDSDGTTGYIRAGYTIPIMNNAGDRVFVVPYRSSTSTSSTYIVDANGNQNQYFQMAGDNNKFTNFIYIGNSNWFADKDT